MVETILCLGLITVAALGLIAALTRLMVAQSSSSHHTVARIIADSVMQQVVLSAHPPDPLAPPTIPPTILIGYDFDTVLPKQATVGQNAELVEFSYRVTAEKVNPPASFDPPPPADVAPTMGGVYEITVTVWWNSDDAYEGAIERGTQTIEVSTLTYIET